MNRLNSFFTDTAELRKLISENPDLPIVMLVDGDVVADCDHSSWFCNTVKCYKATILDTDEGLDDQKIYMSEDELEEYLDNKIFDNPEEYFPEACAEGTAPTDEEYERVLREEMKKYEPYWRECIIVHGRN